jgi:lipoprotein-anchoring transpeptidase ErfK/SrfK
MTKRILAILAVAAAGVAGTSVVMTSAVAQTYAQPTTPSYPAPPGSYPPPAAGDRMPDFDALDDEAPAGLSSPGLPQPAPGVAPSNQALGPVMSPDDPRYGRPAGPPPVIYSDRPAQRPDGSYASRAPGAGFIDPSDRPMRPPGGIEGGAQVGSAAPGYAPQGYPAQSQPYPGPQGQPAVTGAVPQGADGRPVSLSALPPDEQPETGPRKELPERLRRKEVTYVTKEPAGTIIVDTPNTQLYYVLGNNRAIRYGVRVGRDGFTWTGVQKITRKAEWPDWHPPPEMIERQPYLPRFMAGGDGNPLGARAMYLGSTVYRIHGTNQPSTIGQFVSSGCIGMLNEDVSDLFERVKIGTRVVVLPGGKPPAPATTTASADPARPAPAAISGAGTGPTVVPPLPAPVTIR